MNLQGTTGVTVYGGVGDKIEAGGYIHELNSSGSLVRQRTGGSVEFATILAGYHFDLPQTGDAKIGAVKIKATGSQAASSLASRTRRNTT